MGKRKVRRASVEQVAFEDIAYAHPHEVHDMDQERFWEYFHRLRPAVTREQMERYLATTEAAWLAQRDPADDYPEAKP